jgi:hypothetical protein
MKSAPYQSMLCVQQTCDGTSPGTSYAVLGRDMIDAKDYGTLCIHLTTDTPTGTTPTLDMKLQDSIDGYTWYDLVAFTQVTTVAASQIIRIPGPGTSDPKTFARCLRVMGKVGGTTPSYTLTEVKLELRQA